MALTDQMIDEAFDRYKREQDRYHKLAELVFQKCLDIVQKKLTIRATVQRRVKDPISFKKKLKKKESRSKYNSVDDIFSNISDLAGVRIITYLESDRTPVVEELKKVFIGKATEQSPEIDIKDKDTKGKHYRATHCQIYLSDEDLGGKNENLVGTTCEIQVCSLLAHVFNEIEHDLQYKPLSGSLSPLEDELLNQLGLLTKAGDITIKSLLDAADTRLKNRTGEFSDVHDFVVRLRVVLELDSKFSNNAGQLYEELIQLGINSPERITQELIAGEEVLKVIALEEYTKLKKFAIESNCEYELEDGSSDVLLAALLRKFAEKIIENHPTGRGKGRPSRLVQIARTYKELKNKKTTANTRLCSLAG